MIGTKKVLVIGATGGVGHAASKLLMETNHYVIGTCRTEKQRQSLEADEICNLAVPMDLASYESINAAVTELKQQGIDRLAGVVNCAAVAHLGALELMTQEEFEALFQINVYGPLMLARLTIPLLREGRGRLVMIGSVAGDLSLPLLGAYSASKSAIEAICDALRRELSPWNIHVALVNPGGIKTAMGEKHVLDLEKIISSPPEGMSENYIAFYQRQKKILKLGHQNGVSPERVAEDIYEALTDLKPKARYYPGVEPMIVSSLSRYLPDSIQDKLLKQLFSRKKETKDSSN